MIEVTDPNYRYLIQNDYFSEATNYPIEGAITLGMKAGECHLNAATVSQKKGYKHIIGFVRDSKGWKTHSWLLNGNKIIETGSTLGLEYYGIELPKEILKIKGGDVN